MTLQLQECLEVVASPMNQLLSTQDTTAVHFIQPSIIKAYDEAGGGLLLLGAPGTGKSTLLRTLALELIQRAKQDSTQSIPLILNLTSWAEQKTSLSEWLVEQLLVVYTIPRQQSREVLEQQQFLFLLDGLDEVLENARAACIETINTHRTTQGTLPMVICSRTQEFKHLQQQEHISLHLSYAVEVQALIPNEVMIHLQSLGHAFAGVREALHTNPVLSNLVTTPLLLNVIISTYRDTKAKDLPQLGTPIEQQRQVFAHYVTQQLTREKTSWHYSGQQTFQWLIYLAQQMQQHQQSELFLEQLQRTWLPTLWLKRAFPWLTGLLFSFLLMFINPFLFPFGFLIGLFFGVSSKNIKPVEQLR